MQMTHSVMSDTVRFTMYRFLAVCICALLATTKLTNRFVTRPATISKAYTIISATSAWLPKSRSSRCLSLNRISNASSKLKLKSGKWCRVSLICELVAGASDWRRSSISSNLWISARVEASFRSSQEDVREAGLMVLHGRLALCQPWLCLWVDTVTVTSHRSLSPRQNRQHDSKLVMFYSCRILHDGIFWYVCDVYKHWIVINISYQTDHYNLYTIIKHIKFYIRSLLHKKNLKLNKYRDL